MKKQCLVFILLLSFLPFYGQELIQEASVKKAYNAVEDGWEEATFKSPTTIYSNRQGYLKISGAEFLVALSGNKAKLEANTAYETAELVSPVLAKSKTEKNGLVNSFYTGKLVYKTIDGVYTPEVSVVYSINEADVVRLQITNNKSSKEYILDLEIK
jgi:hypothetical protein